VWLIASLQLALENFSRLPDQPCVGQQTIETLCQRIAQLKQADPTCFIIVSLHWGWENHLEVVPRQRYEARQLIDAGADCLVCHHTHTLQPGETYQGKPIFYSLGNFIFDPRNDLNRQGAMVRLTITEQEATAEELPIVIRQCTPYLKK
jgi:poly-gamma-glutamate synthesis protein (capsule biosynthesis protein)